MWFYLCIAAIWAAFVIAAGVSNADLNYRTLFIIAAATLSVESILKGLLYKKFFFKR